MFPRLLELLQSAVDKGCLAKTDFMCTKKKMSPSGRGMSCSTCASVWEIFETANRAAKVQMAASLSITNRENQMANLTLQ